MFNKTGLVGVNGVLDVAVRVVRSHSVAKCLSQMHYFSLMANRKAIRGGSARSVQMDTTATRWFREAAAKNASVI